MTKSQTILATLLVGAGIICLAEAQAYVSKLSSSQATALEKALNNNYLQPAYFVAATTRQRPVKPV